MPISLRSKITQGIKTLIWLAVLIFILQGLIWLKLKFTSFQAKEVVGVAQEDSAEEKFCGFPGEQIIYNVKLGGMTLGKADFRHISRTRLGAKVVNLMTFQTSLARFNDLEKIYSDARTFLPLLIERDVFIWPNQEKITENYDQDKFTLSITKFKGKNKEELLINKTGAIQNAILLPFALRLSLKLDIGWSLVIRLPTQEFVITLVSIEDVTVPAGIFKSYHFRSTPRKFEIWVSIDERRIPVKIRTTGFLGYTMVMKEYRR
ncbi:MAG: DUF3108 domain-containing protein [Candidatus Omnitrophota bacterium]